MPKIIKQQWRRLVSLDATRGAAILLMIPLHSVLVALLVAGVRLLSYLYSKWRWGNPSA